MQLLGKPYVVLTSVVVLGLSFLCCSLCCARDFVGIGVTTHTCILVTHGSGMLLMAATSRSSQNMQVFIVHTVIQKCICMHVFDSA